MGSGVPIARQAKRTELPSIADLPRNFSINSGSRRRSFGFSGSSWGFGAISTGGADFSIEAITGATVSTTGDGFLAMKMLKVYGLWNMALHFFQTPVTAKVDVLSLFPCKKIQVMS